MCYCRSCLSLASDVVKTLCERRTSCILLGKEEGGRERERENNNRSHLQNAFLTCYSFTYIDSVCNLKRVCVCVYNTVFYLIISFLYAL